MANFFGTPNTLIQTPRYGKPQANALDILTQRGLQNSNFQGIEDLARKNFQTQTIPSLAERFTAMGGGQRSSAFQGALGSAASNLETQLGALRGQHGLQELQLGLEPQYDNFLQQEKEGLGMQALGSLGNYAGQAGLNYYDKKWTADNLAAAEKARQEGMKTGGQGGFVDAAAQQANQAASSAKDVGGGTLAGLAAKASGYAVPLAAGTAAGVAGGYLANKAGVPEDASYGIGGTIGGSVAAATAGVALGPVLAWGVAAGLSAYGLKKLYNYWSQANPGKENSLENRMALLQLQGQ